MLNPMPTNQKLTISMLDFPEKKAWVNLSVLVYKLPSLAPKPLKRAV